MGVVVQSTAGFFFPYVFPAGADSSGEKQFGGRRLTLQFASALYRENRRALGTRKN